MATATHYEHVQFLAGRLLNWGYSTTGEQPVPVWVTTQSTAILYYSANQPEWCRPIQMIQMVHY